MTVMEILERVPAKLSVLELLIHLSVCVGVCEQNANLGLRDVRVHI